MRGLERDLVIIDRKDYNENRRYIKNPVIEQVVRWGNGWIDVRMSDGFVYRRTGGTLSWRYNNPGNIKYGKFARSHKAVGRGWGSHGGHAVFPDYKTGRWAKKVLLFTPVRKYYNLTIREALSYYAPRGDNNNPDRYARFIVNRTQGVSLETRLRNMNDMQQEQMLTAMEKFEGWKPGKITRL